MFLHLINQLVILPSVLRFFRINIWRCEDATDYMQAETRRWNSRVTLSRERKEFGRGRDRLPCMTSYAESKGWGREQTRHVMNDKEKYRTKWDVLLWFFVGMWHLLRSNVMSYLDECIHDVILELGYSWSYMSVGIRGVFQVRAHGEQVYGVHSPLSVLFPNLFLWSE